MTLIKDLIDIPDRVQKGDFVLKLSEDIQRPDVVLKDYVVTPELARNFDAALTFIRSAVQGRTSKATYLHGSFGSGKSHFMAVLHLILQGHPEARAIPELAAVIKKHNDWLDGKRFLLVPYHMLNSHDMESGILGGYVDFMRAKHPDKPIPPVYMSATIIEQAEAERANYGDEAFFKRLNAGDGSDEGWGELGAGWDAASFEAAATAPPDSEEHLRLVSKLLKTIATSHVEVISHRGGNFVRFDKGLSIISQHAESLGYDALILFLDELILWLAMNSADLGFVNRQAGKLTNLVEAQSVDRPVPLVSFVARQRDLRELVGDHVPGAQRLSFGDSLDYQQGRFDTITLEDRNLPAIAEKRVLRCKNRTARDELDAAFEQVARMNDSVMNILLTHEGNRDMFRQVYPFSPALVQTLIAVSSVLQRERTALKVMMQLLVDHRDTLAVGDVVPVGDLFDVVAHGDEAFSQDMAIHFDNAKRLYHQKLLPVLEKKHGRREEIEELSHDDPRRAAFRNDDRLVKTLLLSALVPEVESLRGLNAEKLAALNHGTIRTPIPGREAQEVLSRCRNWAASVGEIRIGEEVNPTIAVQLSGVDTESIIEQACREDNQGNRIRRVRQMLFEHFGIQGEGEFEQYHEFWWRNTKRNCTVVFRNIRELPFSALENADADWKVVIDYPFDDAGRGPRDDVSRIQEFMDANPDGARTLCWVPSFLSEDAQKDLGTLVILEHVLTGERFIQYANHLSPQDRQAAKSLLENQRSVLQQRVKNHLDAAYGLEAVAKGSLDTVHALEPGEQFCSLCPGFVPRPPVAANLADAMQKMLDQALSHDFPAAPYFEAEVKSGALKKVCELVSPATETADGRVLIESSHRPLLRKIANPLRLGEMGVDATYFVLGQHWPTHFARKQAETGGPLLVQTLRRWIDEPQPMGLPPEAQNLVILLFASQADYVFFRLGGPYEPTLQSLPNDCELRKVKLPPTEEWEPAVQRAGSIFGVAGHRLLSAGNVNSLSTEVKKKAEQVGRACEAYSRNLRDRLACLGIAPDEADRMKTARTTQKLVTLLTAAEPANVVEVLARAEIATSDAAMGECVGKAAELEGNLETAGWEVFQALGELDDDRKPAAEETLSGVRQALAADEHVTALAPALKGAHAAAVRLLVKQVKSPEEPVDRPKPPVEPPMAKGKRVVDRGTKQDLSLAEAKQTLEEVGRKVSANRTARVSVNWVVEEDAT